ncbi:TolC family protein [Luteolibacter yonseiensis]|uniref:TolC family protein n=1 Tax=Luteolibacter yonseiensis TaxID=1144680 RepID=A0A934R565_9BACT|nr:TolC family protein [Luteolibacter yonseiensis]MBK1817376.1 TolC family protein [Luteolibacter yonseiensis]
MPKPGETLSFGQAAWLALENNPGLQPFNPALRAADGKILQASLRPNPTLEGRMENILGSNGATRGFDAAESTVAISQLIENGGKLEARREVEIAEKALVRSDYQIARRELFAEVSKAFAQTLAAQEKVALYMQLVELNESFIPEIDKRIEAGKVTAVEKVRAKTAVTTARLATQQAQREFRTAALRLAATWGSTTAGFSKVSGTLGELPSLSDQASLEQRLYSHPAYQKESREVSKSVAENRLAIANGKSDVTVQGGVKHFWEGNDEVALVVGLSIPIPFNNWNQGEIASTKAEIEVAQKQRDAKMNSLRAELNASVQTLASVRREVETIKSELLPGAQEAFDGVQDGYSKGRFGYLDLIEARRNLTEARVQLLTANAAYHESAAEIAGLTAPMPGESASK